MPKQEIQTIDLIEKLTALGKSIYVPKISGKKPEDMLMLKLRENDNVSKFSRDKWGIPELPLDKESDHNDPRIEGVMCDDPNDLIDLVITPGVAFSETGDRLGHGKGYYDSFFSRLNEARLNIFKSSTLSADIKKSKISEAIFVAVAFDEQILPKIPMSEHDKRIDILVTPTRTIICNPLKLESISL